MEDQAKYLTKKKKILLIGHKRHGKGTVAKLLKELYGFKAKSSSEAALDVFLYDALKDKYNYKSKEEAYEDRVNRRAEWYTLIREFNKEDDTRLASIIMQDNDIYDGLRDYRELQQCREKGIFDVVIGIYNPNLPEEGRDSFNLDLFEESDFIIINQGDGLEPLKQKLLSLKSLFFNH
jgi:hypothetical protein